MDQISQPVYTYARTKIKEDVYLLTEIKGDAVNKDTYTARFPGHEIRGEIYIARFHTNKVEEESYTTRIRTCKTIKYQFNVCRFHVFFLHKEADRICNSLSSGSELHLSCMKDSATWRRLIDYTVVRGQDELQRKKR
jgi:hypothetical protein